MRYPAYERLVRPARPSAAVWRLLAGIVLAGVVMFGLSRAFFALSMSVLQADAYWTLSAEVDRANTPRGMLILLFLMGSMGVGAVVAAHLLHGRGLTSLIGPWPLAWAQFRRVAVALVSLSAVVALLPPWTLWRDLEPGLAPGLWVALLPLTLLGLLIQTASEEILFRGYLQSQLAARFGHPAVWMGVPSVLFAAGHYAPDVFGSNALWIVLWAGVFGVIAADLTARAGTLGPAIALHLVNNVMALGLVSLQGEMAGLSLTQLPFGPDDEAALRALLLPELALLVLAWLAARVALRV